MHPTPLQRTTQRRLRYALALLLCSAVLACKSQSLGSRLHIPSSLPNPPAQATTLAQKDPSMQDITTIELNWGIFMKRYQLDMGSTRITTLEGGNWMKDAEGNFIREWYGITGTPMGGNESISRLPKTMRVSYYDYQENRFYQLDAELPQETLYQLFQQRMAAIDSEAIEQRFDTIVIGIYPQGHIMTWVMGGGLNCVELKAYQARVLPDMSIARYNSEGSLGPLRQRGFPLSENRWAILHDPTDYNPLGTALRAETIAKLKAGELPQLGYYLQRRVRYPWRFQMSGNARLLEFSERDINEEALYVAPWQMQLYNSHASMRCVPTVGTFWFNDKAGKRHRVFIQFFNRWRVSREADVSPLWQAFNTLSPDRKVENNSYLPQEEDVVTFDVHVSDDLKTYTASLIKGTQRIPIPIGQIQHFELEPFAHYPGQKTPNPERIKRMQNGI